MWKIVFSVLAAVLAVGSAGMLVGGFRDVDPNTTAVQNALNFAVVKHNLRTDDAFIRKPSRVVRVQSQVVSGMKYVMTVEMSRTSCRKNSALEECTVHEEPEMAKPYLCTFTVVTRPWMSEINLLEDKCPTANI